MTISNNTNNNNNLGDGGGITRVTAVTRGDGTEGGEEENCCGRDRATSKAL